MSDESIDIIWNFLFKSSNVLYIAISSKLIPGNVSATNYFSG